MATRGNRNPMRRIRERWEGLSDTARMVILIVAAVIACAVMLYSNPFSGNAGDPPAAARTSASSSKADDSRKTGDSTKTMPSDKTDETGSPSSKDPGFTGSTDDIGEKVQSLLDSPDDGTVDSMGTLLYRYGEPELADGRMVLDSIGAGENRHRVRQQALSWWDSASSAAADARLADIKSSAPNMLKGARKAKAYPGAGQSCSTLESVAGEAVKLVRKGAKTDYDTLTDMQIRLNKAMNACSDKLDADQITQAFGDAPQTKDQQ